MTEPSLSIYGKLLAVTCRQRKGNQEQRWNFALDIDGSTKQMTAFSEDVVAIAGAGYDTGGWHDMKTIVLDNPIPLYVTPDKDYGFRMDRENVSPREDNYSDEEYTDQSNYVVKGYELKPGMVVYADSVNNDPKPGEWLRTYYRYEVLSEPRKNARNLFEMDVRYLDDFDIWQAGETRTIGMAKHSNYTVLTENYLQKAKAG